MAKKKKGILGTLADALFGSGSKKSSSSRSRHGSSSKVKTSSGKSTGRSSSSNRTSSSKKTPPKSVKKTPSKSSTGNSGKSKENVSKRYPNGRTLETADKYLPTDKRGKSQNPKERRRVVIIDSNRKDEIAVVRLTTQRQSNTTELPTYKKGNGLKSFFKHFVEIFDSEKKPIKVDGKKFKENPRSQDLTGAEVQKIKTTVLGHVKQSTENQKKITALKESGDKERID